MSKILSFFGAFGVVFGPDLGSNRVAFEGLFGPGFGAYPKGPDFGPKSPYFRGFWRLFDPKSLDFVSFS